VKLEARKPDIEDARRIIDGAETTDADAAQMENEDEAAPVYARKPRRKRDTRPRSPSRTNPDGVHS
jgi:hypothetical protein